MKRYIFIAILIILAKFAFSSSILDNARVLYMSASESEKDCKKLFDISNNSDNVILKAYNAASMMIMAKFIKNPLSKLASFNKGKKKLELCIKYKPRNIELLFLRFSIQSESPSFLGYNSNLNDDKNMIFQNYTKSNDVTLRYLIKSFMIKSTNILQSEKLIFNK